MPQEVSLSEAPGTNRKKQNPLTFRKVLKGKGQPLANVNGHGYPFFGLNEFGDFVIQHPSGSSITLEANGNLVTKAARNNRQLADNVLQLQPLPGDDPMEEEFAEQCKLWAAAAASVQGHSHLGNGVYVAPREEPAPTPVMLFSADPTRSFNSAELMQTTR